MLEQNSALLVCLVPRGALKLPEYLTRHTLQNEFGVKSLHSK